MRWTCALFRLRKHHRRGLQERVFLPPCTCVSLRSASWCVVASVGSSSASCLPAVAHLSPQQTDQSAFLPTRLENALISLNRGTNAPRFRFQFGRKTRKRTLLHASYPAVSRRVDATAYTLFSPRSSAFAHWDFVVGTSSRDVAVHSVAQVTFRNE